MPLSSLERRLPEFDVPINVRKKEPKDEPSCMPGNETLCFPSVGPPGVFSHVPSPPSLPPFRTSYLINIRLAALASLTSRPSIYGPQAQGAACAARSSPVNLQKKGQTQRAVKCLIRSSRRSLTAKRTGRARRRGPRARHPRPWRRRQSLSGCCRHPRDPQAPTWTRQAVC